MKNLDVMLEMYNTLQDEETKIKTAKENLKKEILEELSSRGLNSYISSNGAYKGTVAAKTTFKYTDEFAIINYLQNNNMSIYLKTTIDTTSFNKTLKNSQTLQENLKGKFTVNEVPALTVKKNI